MPHQNQKNPASWLGKTQEHSCRNQWTPQPIYTQVRCGSKIWDAKGFLRFPSFFPNEAFLPLSQQITYREIIMVTEFYKEKARKRVCKERDSFSYLWEGWIIIFRVQKWKEGRRALYRSPWSFFMTPRAIPMLKVSRTGWLCHVCSTSDDSDSGPTESLRGSLQRWAVKL